MDFSQFAGRLSRRDAYGTRETYPLLGGTLWPSGENGFPFRRGGGLRDHFFSVSDAH